MATMRRPTARPRLPGMDDSADIARLEARSLYWQGYKVAEIARQLGIAYGTVDAWKRRDRWDDDPVIKRIEAGIDRRLLVLIAKPEKTDRDLQEIDHLSRVLERTARVQRYEGSGRESDLNPAIHNRASGRKRKAEENNTLTEEQVADLVAAFRNGLFGYQLVWEAAKSRYRVRNILKSRQIGATWYFAREALIDAVLTGDNQIFLSASKAQATVFRDYIVQFVKDVTGVELRGTPIKLWNGAILYFLGTNSKTAQSYHGHVYIDEYAWIGKFAEFRKVASAMATHKKWRITYFSTPSTIAHDAHGFWSGESFNQGRAKADLVAFDVSHGTLRKGAVGPDGQWRHMVTIEDAQAQGCDLFDIDQLRREYNENDFANLFLCRWVDDTSSFFTLDEVMRCGVDSWDTWTDVLPGAARPYAGPVWIGYDPSRSRDDASIAVVAPPTVPGGTYRVIERKSFSGADFHAQAAAVREMTTRYQVEHIGVDITGIGQGVFELVRNFWPAATAITYSVESKSRMVLKAKHLISRRMLAWDGGQRDVAMAFLSIRKVATPSGRQATFQASRSQETGHADVAWAIMHAIDRIGFVQLDGEDNGGTSRPIMEIF